MKRLAVFVACAATALALAAPAFSQGQTLAQARAAGLIGEQTDGYLGFVTGASISAELRGRVNQNNMQRRAAYSRQLDEARAAGRIATLEEIAYAVACGVFENRIAVGEYYRTETGEWRQRAAGEPAQKGARCPA
ncbi:MAG: DUF1318 domain-containing protein [Hyphomonadaceae bacterium]